MHFPPTPFFFFFFPPSIADDTGVVGNEQIYNDIDPAPDLVHSGYVDVVATPAVMEPNPTYSQIDTAQHVPERTKRGCLSLATTVLGGFWAEFIPRTK